MKMILFASIAIAMAHVGACVFLHRSGTLSKKSFSDVYSSSARAATHRRGEGESKPHIIFVLADDLGYNGIGYNNEELKTPVLDRLAKNGVKLTSYYAGPICGPSRFSLLTGRDSWKSEAWTSNQFAFGIPSGTSLTYKMLPAALKEAGYATHMVGKWHQGYYAKEYHPQNRGFDTFYGALDGCVIHATQQDCEGFCGNRGRVLDLTDSARQITVDDINTSLVADDRYRLRAVEIIRNHDIRQPLFLYVSFHHPHLPLDTPELYSSRFTFDEEEKNKYYGMISNLDDNVHDIVHALFKAHMWENTLFIFSSDNGGTNQEYESANFTKYLNYPFRGIKGMILEGGIRVPAFVSGGFLPQDVKGTHRDGVTSIIDWYATLTSLAGVQVDESGPYGSDTIANWDYIIGERNTSARAGVLQFQANMQFAYIEGKWKLHSYPNGKISLYNLETDLKEEHDLSAKNSEIVSRLQAQFKEWSFKRFIDFYGRVEETGRTCTEVGFNRISFARKFCAARTDTFLKEFDNGPTKFLFECVPSALD